MNKPLSEIKGYYDALVVRKLRDFVDGNDRIECAWATVERAIDTHSQLVRLLEIGCGIGAVCWRLSLRCPNAEVIGTDISSKSVAIAQHLFGSDTVSFVEGPLIPEKLTGRFDLILLMDVYEHISREDRSTLHRALKTVLQDGGRIILSFPTPRHLAWLRHQHPEELQPVDEDISIDTISTLAQDTGTNVLFYQEVRVWHEGDYAHAILGNTKNWSPTPSRQRSLEGNRANFLQRFLKRNERFTPDRAHRLATVQRRLGKEIYPA